MPVLALLQRIGTNCEAVRVLDSCAAPGGKFLLLAGALFHSRANRADCLVAIERDKFRLIDCVRIYGYIFHNRCSITYMLYWVTLHSWLLLVLHCICWDWAM